MAEIKYTKDDLIINGQSIKSLISSVNDKADLAHVQNLINNVNMLVNGMQTELDNHEAKLVSQEQDGHMSKEDKAKLDGIEEGANNYVHPDTHDVKMIRIFGMPLNQFLDDLMNGFDNAIIEHRQTKASQEQDGHMSKEDKIKLDGIEEGANKTDYYHDIAILPHDEEDKFHIGTNIYIPTVSSSNEYYIAWRAEIANILGVDDNETLPFRIVIETIKQHSSNMIQNVYVYSHYTSTVGSHLFTFHRVYGFGDTKWRDWRIKRPISLYSEGSPEGVVAGIYGLLCLDILNNKLYIKKGSKTTSAKNTGWELIGELTGGNVASVNGKTGEVVIDVGDIAGLVGTKLALGSNASAGDYSVALGSNASAGNSAVALGYDASATGYYSVALGRNASAKEYYSVALGRNASAAGNSAVALGYVASAAGSYSVALGRYASAENNYEGILGGTGTSRTSKWKVPGDFTVSGTKNFEIPHPKPEKSATHVIRHGAVESPTPGDTLYRWKIQATKDNDIITIDLPDYFIYLNKDVQIFVTPQGHFGNGYGTLNRETEQLEIHCQFAGEYNVLVIGTRNDDHQSVQDWNIKGVEREIGESWTGETYAFSIDEIIEIEEIKEVSA